MWWLHLPVGMSIVRYVFCCRTSFDIAMTNTDSFFPCSAQQAQQRCASTVSCHLWSRILRRKASRYTPRLYIHIQSHSHPFFVTCLVYLPYFYVCGSLMVLPRSVPTWLMLPVKFSLLPVWLKFSGKWWAKKQRQDHSSEMELSNILYVIYTVLLQFIQKPNMGLGMILDSAVGMFPHKIGPLLQLLTALLSNKSTVKKVDFHTCINVYKLSSALL